MKRIALKWTIGLVGVTWALGVQAVPVLFTKLTGVTGGAPAGTAVYRADLSGLGLLDIASITIADNSSGLGGSPGQFTGFDLDAIISHELPLDATPEAFARNLTYEEGIHKIIITL